MAIATNLGFPRLGAHRDLKRAVEAYWAGKLDQSALLAETTRLRRKHWEDQRNAGLHHIPSNDFSLYDHILDMTATVGAVPARYGVPKGPVTLDTYFAMARGSADLPAMEMTKWFDTNYHYIVPEFEKGQRFRLASTKAVDEFKEALSIGIRTRPVLIGPITYLLLGKVRDGSLEPLELLDELLYVYEELLRQLATAGAEWVQMDEPALTLTLTETAKAAFGPAYGRLADASPGLRLLLATYFGEIRENASIALSLPVDAIHVDLTHGSRAVEQLLPQIPATMALSLGIVDGRNVWRTDYQQALIAIERAVDTLGTHRVMVAPSCSLLHCPVDVDLETAFASDTRSWMAFARQKVEELAILARAANQGRESIAPELAENAARMEQRRASPRVHDPQVKQRLASISSDMMQRGRPYQLRRQLQQQVLRLPMFPTTTIGSFPQTADIRRARAAFRRGDITSDAYSQFLRQEIANVVAFQEEVGLDVLVHGEAERNDMVEYFGEQLEGYVHTTNGWVQSYGSRAVKPPIILGDVSRRRGMTVEWTTYAQSLTDKPLKGMLTGPVTMLQWSFVRDDQPRSETCRQIALAIRDEVTDLERAGIQVIQIDEPAFREGLPLRAEDWDSYLTWAIECFRLASSGVSDQTQIHTHMCYSEFNDIVRSIADLDADVISIESSRSNMELLDSFVQYRYPNEIGPGIYDIHSPRVATTLEMRTLLDRALAVLDPEQLWVNPDCGLKTRGWGEVRASLVHMVEAAQQLRGHEYVERT